MSAMLAGTRPLLRASLRFDGCTFIPWIMIAIGLSVSAVLIYPVVFPTAADRAGLSGALGANPALGLIFGPAFDLSTTDGFNAWRSLALGGFFTGLGSIFTVTQTTRGQEDSGQAELLASGVLGRASRLMSGIGVALMGSLLLGILTGVLTGLCGGEWEESLLLGATFTATGWMFTAIAAVTVQLGSDRRAANSLAVGVLGSLFVLRGFQYSIGAPTWTLWLNPLAWMTETRPSSGNHWWPLLLAVGLSIIVLAIAFALQVHRDFGQGLVAPRPGPAVGTVTSLWRLALRLNQGPIITWTMVFLVLGIVFGYFTSSISEILRADSAVSQILAAGATTQEALISGFVLTILSLVGIIATIPGVQIIVKVRTEEMEGRVEPIMAGSLTRQRYYGAHVILAFLTSALVMVLAGVVVAAMAAWASIGVDFGDILLQSFAVIPALWTVVAVSVAVVGARPEVALAAWAGVFASFVLTLLGPTFKLPDWVLGISPFWHVTDVSAGQMHWPGVLGLSLATGVFLTAGFTGFRRRDLAR